MSEVNQNSLLYWLPKVEGLDIPTPKTCYIYFTDINFFTKIRDFCIMMGFPVFMKTDLAAAKHDWDKSCFVRNAEEIITHLDVLMDTDEIWEPLGATSKAIVIREFLELETSFTAFDGNMPINTERRYFIDQGKVLCHHPYWPEDAFNEHPSRMARDTNWRAKLAVMNTESEQEIELLSEYARRVGKVMPEYWSVDFAKARAGKWYLIDMALGKNSYHWPNCPKVIG